MSPDQEGNVPKTNPLERLTHSYAERQLLKGGRHGELLRHLQRRQRRWVVLWSVVVVVMGASATISMVEFGRDGSPINLISGLADFAIVIGAVVSATVQWARLREGIRHLRGLLPEEGDGPGVRPAAGAPPNHEA